MASYAVAVALFSTLVAICFGIWISYKTARAVTVPLNQLMQVTQQIAETGDLDHKTDVTQQDEIGQLARVLRPHGRLPARNGHVSEQIAGGNLTVDVKPRSERDTLGRGFLGMWKDCTIWCAPWRDAAFAGCQRIVPSGYRFRRIGQDQPAGLSAPLTKSPAPCTR